MHAGVAVDVQRGERRFALARPAAGEPLCPREAVGLEDLEVLTWLPAVNDHLHARSVVALAHVAEPVAVAGHTAHRMPLAWSFSIELRPPGRATGKGDAVEVILAGIAGVGFAGAGLAALAGKGVAQRLRAAAIGLAGGILLAIAVAELFPEALELAGHERAAAGFIAGFVVLFVIESVTRGHTHHDHAADDPRAHAGVAPHALLPFVIGLTLHNLADGFTIGASHELSEQAASAVAIGILIHQLPVGVSFAAVLAADHVRNRRVVQLALLLGLAIPLGALLLELLPRFGDQGVGVVMAVAAGALTYIAAGHLLPEAHSERRSWLTLSTFPLALMATAYVFLHVLPHD